MLSVLIVEDDISIADMLQEAVEIGGYSVIGIACNVDDAMNILNQRTPDFAIVDVHLENGDLGTDVTTYLRKNTTISILFSTGSANDPELTKADGDAVITKPYLMSDVRQGLEILTQIATSGQTLLKFPRSFRLLEPVS